MVNLTYVEIYDECMLRNSSVFIRVGWFGFNGGSAYAANARAGLALLCTQIATSCAALSWMLTEWYIRKRPSVLGMASGAVSGLVAITPAAGYVNPTGAFVIGVVAGPFCLFGAQLKHHLGFDDALDAFGVHAIGGILGGLMTGLFADAALGGTNGAFFGNPIQLLYQVYGILYAIGWSACVSLLLLLAIDRMVGLRVSPSDERHGLDFSLHGETIILNLRHDGPLSPPPPPPAPDDTGLKSEVERVGEEAVAQEHGDIGIGIEMRPRMPTISESSPEGKFVDIPLY